MHNFYKYPYYRGCVSPLSKPIINSKPPPPKPPPPKPCPPKKPKKNKFDFKCLKNDTCKSLNEVECFLNNFSDFVKYIKLINLIKK